MLDDRSGFRRPRAVVMATLASALVLSVMCALPHSAAAQTRPPDAAGQGAPADSVTLYERLGGYDAIVHFVGVVFPRVASHPDLVHLFRGHGLDSQRRQFQLVVDMVCGATGGPCTYLGRDMARVHEGLEITPAMWDVFMDIVGQGIDEAGYPPSVAEDFRDMWASFRASVVRPAP
jgi:hemoglobin